MKKQILFLSLICCLLLIGCRSRKDMPSTPRPHKTETRTQTNTTTQAPSNKPTRNSNQEQTQTPSAKPSTNTSTPSTPKTYAVQNSSADFRCMVKNISASGQLRWQRDSVIWISISKFIELARIKMTQDSVIAYIKPTNEYLMYSMPEFTHSFGITFQDMQDLLTGKELNSPYLTATVTPWKRSDADKLVHIIEAQLNHPRLSMTGKLEFSNVEPNTNFTCPIKIPKSASRFNL